VVCDFVALGVGCGGRGGEFFVVGEFRVETDEEVVVVEECEGRGEGCAGGQMRDVVEGCG
jgi:hypothetical protein